MTPIKNLSRFSGLAPWLMVLVLAGCGSMKPLPSDTFYRLNIVPAAGGEPWTEKPIRVAKFRASGVHRERAIAYSTESDIAIKQYRYQLWIDSPERLLQNELFAYLRADRVAPAITESPTTGGYEIRGTVRRFERIVEAGRVSVVVALAFEIVAPGSGETTVLAREYEESLAVESEEMTATATAMSRSVSSIFQRFVADARAALHGAELSDLDRFERDAPGAVLVSARGR
jgi:ABC-type uncharacterized transport system auxiliary subunit